MRAHNSRLCWWLSWGLVVVTLASVEAFPVRSLVLSRHLEPLSQRLVVVTATTTTPVKDNALVVQIRRSPTTTTCCGALLESKHEPEQKEPLTVVPHKEKNPVSLSTMFSAALYLVVVASCGVTLWSEAAIYQSGCGPLALTDMFERTSYQIVLVAASVAWFVRLAFQQDLVTFLLANTTANTAKRGWQQGWVRGVEGLLYAAVLGALVTLWHQDLTGQANLWESGLSGIDETACRAQAGFQKEFLAN